MKRILSGNRVGRHFFGAAFAVAVLAGTCLDRARAEVTVRTIEDVTFVGVPTGISAEGLVSFAVAGKPDPVKLRLGDIESMSFSAKVTWRFDTAYLLLANGDVLPAEMLAGTDKNGLRFKTGLFGEKTIPFKLLRGFFPADLVAADDELETAFARIRSEAGDTDIVTYKREKVQDMIPGTIEKFDGTHLVVSAEFGGSVNMDKKTIRRISFSARHKYDPGEGPRARLRLDDGTLVTGRVTAIDGSGVKLKHFTGAAPSVKTRRIVRIDILGGNLVPIEALKPVAVKEWTEDWGPHPFPYSVNKNALRRPMTMAGKTYPRGLGVRAESSITYDLGGRFREFRATIGHDDIVSSNPGKVRFLVTGDGKKLYESPLFAKGSKPIEIKVDVRGAARLELSVRTPKGVSKSTVSNWALARFLKK